MNRAKKAKGHGWKVKNQQKAEANKPKEQEKKEVSDDEHKKRIEMLKKMGLIKKD